jgi:hypothetical protein
MELLSDDLLAKLQAQDPYHPTGPGRELETDEYLVLAKYFLPDANWTWYAVSASKDEDTGNVQFFGLVNGLELELGYFWLSELKEARGKLGLPMERDLHWQPRSLQQVKEECERERTRA